MYSSLFNPLLFATWFRILRRGYALPGAGSGVDIPAIFKQVLPIQFRPALQMPTLFWKPKLWNAHRLIMTYPAIFSFPQELHLLAEVVWITRIRKTCRPRAAKASHNHVKFWQVAHSVARILALVCGLALNWKHILKNSDSSGISYHILAYISLFDFLNWLVMCLQFQS